MSFPVTPKKPYRLKPAGKVRSRGHEESVVKGVMGTPEAVDLTWKGRSFMTRFVHRFRTALMAGLAALAGTTFQNGCSMGMTGELTSLLDTFATEFSYYDDSYGGYDSGYDSGWDSYDSYDSPLDWDLLDVKSG
jgi:hypothetical protein